MTVKFMYNGIKIDGKLYKAGYHLWGNSQKSGTITLCRHGYDKTPRVDGLKYENDTDFMTDYFDEDRIIVEPDSRYYTEAKSAFILFYQNWIGKVEKKIKKENIAESTRRYYKTELEILKNDLAKVMAA